MNPSPFRGLVCSFVALLASGCATLTGSSTQTIELAVLDARDRPLVGMVCTLTHGAGTYTVQLPAAEVEIRRSGTELEIECRRGDLLARGTVVPRAESAIAHAFLPGGSLATLIDHATGAMYTYPSPLALRAGQHLRFEVGAQAKASVVASVGEATPPPPVPAPTATAPAVAVRAEPAPSPVVNARAPLATAKPTRSATSKTPPAVQAVADTAPPRTAPLTW
ncbi:MAG TPA: hypothetical protein VNK91_00575 [Burkholderiaceae bacterium]|jgi:hypothetical protein|nr:hypothetical protein [Burkholderiaceae bacterium]